MSAVSGQRGSALALVLWLLILLSAVSTAVVMGSRSGSNLILNARARTVVRNAAESGIVAGVALVEHRLATAYSPAQQVLAFRGLDRQLGELREVPLGNARFGVVMANLNARLDLNRADPATLRNLFAEFISPAAADAVVDALQDWRDADDLVRPRGAEYETYVRAGSPFVPRNAPLRRLEEFRRVRGVTDSLVLRTAPFLTVDGDSHIDVNTAPEPVLGAVPGIGPTRARAIVSRRGQGGGYLSVSEVQTQLGWRGAGSAGVPIPGLAVAPSRLLFISRGWLPGHPLTYEIQASYAVVGQRLLLQSWRERDL